MMPLLVLVFVCSLIVSCSSYTIETVPETHPEHQGKCWWSETGTEYSVGEIFTIPDSCVKVECNSDFSVTATGCSIKIIDDKTCHRVVPDISLPFPKCCPEYECIDAQGNKRRI